jgi:hypothetical protein
MLSRDYQVGWLKLDTVDILKEMDPISCDLARGEWLDMELRDGNLMTLDHGATYFTAYDIERYLEDHEVESHDSD